LGSAPRRAVLHVGTPKSGTTFLQRVLWDNQSTLKSQGFRCAGSRPRDMFLAAIELRESHTFWGYPAEDLAGRWSEVCRQAREHPGTTILSHEVLGAATEEQVARAMSELDGLDVHLVLTARDLARQVTSEWQERVKNGGSGSFAAFERRLHRQMSKGTLTGGFWRNHDPVDVFDRWARNLPPSHVHVVTTPQSAADPGLLWRRFAEAVDLDPSDIDPVAPKRAANTTLGVAQIALLRRVNRALDGRIKQPDYARVVKHRFAERLLAGQGSPRPQCPPDLLARLRAVAEDRNETIRQRGYAVHGDLAELVPVEPEGPSRAPDDLEPELERAAYSDAIASLLVQGSEQDQLVSLLRVQRNSTLRGRLRRLGRFLTGHRSGRS